MDKQTTAQVAKALGLTKLQVQSILQYKPALRPSERSGNHGAYLWSEAEIKALREHLTKPSARRYVQHFQIPSG